MTPFEAVRPIASQQVPVADRLVHHEVFTMGGLLTLASVHPSFSSPTRFSAGRRTSSKKTSLNVWAPVISMMGRISRPGVSIGQMK